MVLTFKLLDTILQMFWMHLTEDQKHRFYKFMQRLNLGGLTFHWYVPIINFQPISHWYVAFPIKLWSKNLAVTCYYYRFVYASTLAYTQSITVIICLVCTLK
jgi:hypothetical protein